MAIDDEKLKELDKYNLLKLFESVSVGNVVRAARWTLCGIKSGIDKLSDLADVEPRVPKKR